MWFVHNITLNNFRHQHLSSFVFNILSLQELELREVFVNSSSMLED